MEIKKKFVAILEWLERVLSWIKFVSNLTTEFKQIKDKINKLNDRINGIENPGLKEKIQEADNKIMAQAYGIEYPIKKEKMEIKELQEIVSIICRRLIREAQVNKLPSKEPERFDLGKCVSSIKK